MGLRGRQVLWQVELPLALPLIMTGVRLATVQVVATATIAAYVSFGGLGRYVFGGLAQRDLVQVLGVRSWWPCSPSPPTWRWAD